MTEKIIPIIEDREILIEDDIQESVSENKKPKKSVAEKKNEKRIMRLAGKAIAEFGMIEGGDKVMVCMSGGKDSYVLLDVLMKLQSHNIDLPSLKEALDATCKKRGSAEIIKGYKQVMDQVKSSTVMQEQWTKYQQEFDYASDIPFEDTCDTVIFVMESLE